MTEMDMFLMIESAVRGGTAKSITTHDKANNKYVPQYDLSKESVYLGYFDANNLYRLAMSRPLPFSNYNLFSEC